MDGFMSLQYSEIDYFRERVGMSFFTTLSGGHVWEAIFRTAFKIKVGENYTVSYVLFLGRKYGVEGAHGDLGRKILCLGLVKSNLVE